MASKLKQYLDDHGIKQSFLVEKTGISATKISKIISGDRAMKAEELLAISEALKVDPYFFKI